MFDADAPDAYLEDAYESLTELSVDDLDDYFDPTDIDDDAGWHPTDEPSDDPDGLYREAKELDYSI